MSTAEQPPEAMTEAFCAGRRVGFGISALSLVLITFVSMLGVEKVILAMILGRLAIRGSARGTQAYRLGVAAIRIGICFLVAFAVGLIVFWGRVIEFFEALQRIS
jgi:hypothetical protein